jgi:superfamily II DNA or RNA helicase
MNICGKEEMLMSDLTSFSLNTVYDSSEYDLIEDLIIPLLSNSNEYCRGVGYFSSGWLRMAAEGLSNFVSIGGKAKLIMSPILDEKDWQAIVLGQLARENEVLRNNLESAIDDLAKSLERQTLNTFSWMIADELLDIRFAVPRAGFYGGDYHDKVAYFRDTSGNCVAIHGSFNDSIKGTLNGEAFSVFRSWDEGQIPFIKQHMSRLDRLWNNENPQFHAFVLPEAIRQQIVKLRNTSERPYSLPISALNYNKNKTSPDIPAGIHLHDYQEEAIKAWNENNCCGIFEMATGSGKTYTALAATVKEIKRRKKLAVVILVPYIHLLDQWKKDCVAFGFDPILCGSSNLKWKSELRSAVSDFRLTKPYLCVIAVHQTACSDTFLRAFDKIPKDQKLLIADEVHGLGARQLRNALQNSFEFRLGLSATPKRWYDEEGTQILFDYFKKVCFEFTLEDAINRKFLVSYRYEPQLVHLTPNEEQDISDLSILIGQLLGKKKSNILNEAEQICLEKALRNRALIVKKAELKMDVLRKLIHRMKNEHRDLRYSLFYSPEGQHQDILLFLKDQGIMAHQFIGEDSSSERKRILKQFDNGHITSLVAMKCLDEGVDIPATRTAFFIASTTNPKEFIQRRGRVLRRCINKQRSLIYDFIVVPSDDTPDDVAKYLLEREMPRFAEFADAAENCFDARSIIRPILDRHQMLYLLDMKPWDVYHQHNLETRDE